MTQAGSEAVESGGAGLDAVAGVDHHGAFEGGKTCRDLSDIGRGALGGGAGGGGAEVGGEVGEGGIGLVADTGHDRHGETEDCPHDGLVVEGGEVIGGATAAHDEGEVERLVGGKRAQGGDDAGGGLLALDEGRGDDQLGEGPAAGEHVAHVLDGGARGGGHQADAAGVGGEGALARGLEETLLLQLLAQPFEAGGLDADAFGPEEVADELQIAALGVHRHASVSEDAIASGDLGAGHVVAKEDGAELAFTVAQGEVAVAEPGARGLGDFTDDPEVGKQLASLKHVLEEVDELGDADRVH